MAEVTTKEARTAKKPTASEMCCNGKSRQDVLAKVRDYIHKGYALNEALVIVCGFQWETEHSDGLVTLRLLDDSGKVFAKNSFRSDSTADGVDGCIRLMFGIPFSSAVPAQPEQSAPEQPAEPEPVPVSVPLTPPAAVEAIPVPNVLVPPTEPLVPPTEEKQKGDRVLASFTDYVVLVEELKTIPNSSGKVLGVGGMVACHGKRLPMRCWKKAFTGNFDWLTANWKPKDGCNQIAFKVKLIEHNGSEQFELVSFANQ